VTDPNPPLAVAVFRDLKERCPRCGEGRLFRKYLKVAERCSNCDLEFARYPADDGPAYLTVALVGRLVVAPLLIFPIFWRAPGHTLPVLLPALALVTLVALARIKGGWIGLMYALGQQGRDAPSPAADAVE
jgi:uncharacterized protein (DUF983 family)